VWQLGGPNYAVELGRLDGKSFSRAIVKHVLPGPGFNLDQLNALFAQNGLTQTDMIALSGVLSVFSLLLLLSIPGT
jgi:peroxidase